MKQSRFLVRLLCSMALLSLTTHSQAGFVTHAWFAEINDIGGSGSGDPVLQSLLGEIVEYQYTFDDTSPDFSADPLYGSYYNAISSYGFAVSGQAIGPGATPDWSQVSMWNDHPTYDDSWSAFVSTPGQSIFGLGLEQVNLSLRDYSGTAFSDTVLPSSEPDPAGFSPNGFIQFAVRTLSGLAIVTARSPQVATGSVPVPGTLGLLLFGVFITAFLGRSKVAVK